MYVLTAFLISTLYHSQTNQEGQGLVFTSFSFDTLYQLYNMKISRPDYFSQISLEKQPYKEMSKIFFRINDIYGAPIYRSHEYCMSSYILLNILSHIYFWLCKCIFCCMYIFFVEYIYLIVAYECEFCWILPPTKTTIFYSLYSSFGNPFLMSSFE